MKVPFVDLARQYQELKPEIDAAIDQVLDSGNFIGGNPVKQFETNFASLLQAKNCVALGNATNGLFLALKAYGIGPGDEVITPAWSWISTSEVISLTGATPVFADVDSDYFSITLQQINAKLTDRTKAVIVVHLYGQVAEVTDISNFCNQRNLFLIEDCSQAHLSMEEEKLAGTIGDCGVFSFYPTKNLGAYGDAGCVITNQDALAEKIRRFANHGGLSKDDHLFEGFNSRMDTLQAAILNVKLNYLNNWNEKRRRNALKYFDLLKSIKAIVLPKVRRDTTHTFHQFVIRVQDRDNERDIQTAIHYPRALPFEPAYQHCSYSINDFPISARLQDEVLSLPITPEISEEQIQYVCEAINAYYE